MKRASMFLVATLVATACSADPSSPGGGAPGSPGEIPAPGEPGTPGPDGPGHGTKLSDFASTACTKDRWCWVTPLPHGNTLTSTWATGPNDVWAVGEQNVIAHRDAAGWKGMYFDRIGEEELLAVRGLSASDVWMVGGKQGAASIVHFDGTALTRMQNFVGRKLHAVWPIAASDVWAAGESGALVHYDGQGWSPVPGFDEIDERWNLYALWGASANDLWVGGELDSRESLSHWDGKRFEAARLEGAHWPGRITRLIGTGPADVWAVLRRMSSSAAHVDATPRDEQLLHWDGTTWRAVPDLRPSTFQTKYYNRYDDIVPRGPGDVVALSYDQVVHFDGVGWSRIVAPPERGAPRVLGAIPGSTEVTVVGEGGLCARVGSTWKIEVTPASTHDVVALGAKDVYTAELWRTRKYATNGDVVTTSHVSIGHFDGTAVTPVLTKDHPFAVRDVRLRASGPANVWVAAFGDRLNETSEQTFGTNTSRFDGTSWHDQPIEGPLDFALDMWTFGPDDTWIVGRGGLAHFQGGTWQRDVDSGGVGLWASGPGDLWRSGDPGCSRLAGSGWVQKRTDACGGRMWGSGPNDLWSLTTTPMHLVGANATAATKEPLPSGAASWIFGTSRVDVWVGGRGLVYPWTGSKWGPGQLAGAAGWSEEVGAAFAPNASSVVLGDAWVAVGHGLLRRK
jgi:hypothetical protein